MWEDNSEFLDPHLREGPMNSVSSVRPYVRTYIQYLKIGSLVFYEIWQEGTGQ